MILGPGPVAAKRSRLRAFRVNLTGTSVQGTGCASSGSPPLIAVRSDTSGMRVTLSGAMPNAFSWLLVGDIAPSAWQQHTLPLALNPWGFVGCSLLVPPELIIARTAGSNGFDSGYAVIHAPYTVATTGLGIATQWLCLSPGTGDYAMSARHELFLQ